jgi:transposase-like protein
MTAAKGRAFWERVVREVEAGATQTAVAVRHGVASSTVGAWVRRVRRERVEGAGASAGSTALVAVRVAGEERRRVDVALAGARVQFDEGTEPAYIAAVVRALGGC